MTANQSDTNTDPFTLALDALWSALEASPEVTDVVKLKNRVRRHDDDLAVTQPQDGETNEADFPMLDIVPAGGLVNLSATSTSLTCQQNYELTIAVADARLDRTTFPLYWAIIRAIASFKRQTNGNLGLDFVASVGLTNYTTDEHAARVLQGLAGWSVLATIEVGFNFRHKDIIVAPTS